MKITKKQLEILIENQTRSVLKTMVLKESSDGWDKEYLDDLGLLDWFDKAARVAYDVKNASRGSYCQECGTTFDSLADYLDQLADELKSISEEIMGFDDDDKYYL